MGVDIILHGENTRQATAHASIAAQLWEAPPPSCLHTCTVTFCCVVPTSPWHSSLHGVMPCVLLDGRGLTIVPCRSRARLRAVVPGPELHPGRMRAPLADHGCAAFLAHAASTARVQYGWVLGHVPQAPPTADPLQLLPPQAMAATLRASTGSLPAPTASALRASAPTSARAPTSPPRLRPSTAPPSRTASTRPSTAPSRPCEPRNPHCSASTTAKGAQRRACQEPVPNVACRAPALAASVDVRASRPCDASLTAHECVRRSSAYREPSYGHGIIDFINTTHALWTWCARPPNRSSSQCTCLL